MNSKIETSYRNKLQTLNKRRKAQEEKSELLKETHRSKSEKQYQAKLKRLDKRKEDQYKNIVRKEKWKPPLVVKKKKEPRVTKADQVFSLYIRKKYWPKCYTCNWKADGNWHRKTRACRPLRWCEDNCRPQGFRCCNSKTTGNGRPTEFEYYLKQDGIDVERLNDIYMDWKLWWSKKPNEQEQKEIYEYRKEELAKLE